MSKFQHFQERTGHRRTFSSSFVPLQGVKTGHRRTMSNTATDFNVLNLQKFKIKQDPIPRDSLSPEKSVLKPIEKSFADLLSNSLTHFSQKTFPKIKFSENPAISLKTQLEKLNSNLDSLTSTNTKLQTDLTSHKKILSNMESERKLFDSSSLALSQYSQQLEKALHKATNELFSQQTQNNLLQAELADLEKEKSYNLKSNSSRRQKHVIEKPTPKPITYKPLSQRGLRSSRDSEKAHV